MEQLKHISLTWGTSPDLGDISQPPLDMWHFWSWEPESQKAESCELNTSQVRSQFSCQVNLAALPFFPTCCGVRGWAVSPSAQSWAQVLLSQSQKDLRIHHRTIDTPDHQCWHHLCSHPSESSCHKSLFRVFFFHILVSLSWGKVANMKASKNSLANYKTFSFKSQLKIIWTRVPWEILTLVIAVIFEEYKLFSCYD